jgi:hypothetical protein
MSSGKVHLIYRTTCLSTGKWYIGMHSTSNRDDGYLGSGKVLLRSIKKHGKESHVREILEELPSREALRLREKELITDEMLRDRRCMNLFSGGIGGSHGDDRVTVGLRLHTKRLAEDPKYRAEHGEKLSRAGKVGGAKGASARLQRMANDPVFAAEVKAKIKAGVEANWIKRRFACPS